MNDVFTAFVELINSLKIEKEMRDLILFFIALTTAIFSFIKFVLPVFKKRGNSKSSNRLKYDIENIRDYKKVFDRAAFRNPYAFELSIKNLEEAIDDTLAAINTGSLYSRKKTLLLNVAPKSEFKTNRFQKGFEIIEENLSKLKITIAVMRDAYSSAPIDEKWVKESHSLFIEKEKGFSIGTLLRAIKAGASGDFVREVISMYDEIDSLRNTIILNLNKLLEITGIEPLPLILISSEHIIRSQEIEERNGPRWSKYYIRSHKSLRPYIKDKIISKIDLENIKSPFIEWNHDSSFFEKKSKGNIEAAYNYIIRNDSCYILKENPPENYLAFLPSSEWIGPYRLYSPKDEKHIRFFIKANKKEKIEKEFENYVIKTGKIINDTDRTSTGT